MVMCVCSFICLFLRLSPVKSVTWQHLVESGGLLYRPQYTCCVSDNNIFIILLY